MASFERKSWIARSFVGGNSFLSGCACMTSVSCQMICNTTIWLYGSSAKVGRRGLTCRAWILLWTCPRFPEVLINAHPKVFRQFVYLFSLVLLILLPQHCISWAEHISSSSSTSVWIMEISVTLGNLSWGRAPVYLKCCWIYTWSTSGLHN